MDRFCPVVQKKLHIVHEAEEGGGELRVEVPLLSRDDANPLHAQKCLDQEPLGLFRRSFVAEGSTACFLSGLCEETQLGEAGQAESLPPVTPIGEGRVPEQLTIITTK